MPSKIRPDDWVYFFHSKTPHRGGPLRALANVLICAVLLAIIGFGGSYAFDTYTERQTALAETAVIQQTAIYEAGLESTARIVSTLEARTAIALEQTATAEAANAVPEGIGSGSVIAGGNLRSEARVAPETVIGLIWPGDEVVFLEEQATPNGTWYRIKVTRLATNRQGEGVPEGQEGWASSTLLTPPQ